MLKITKFGLGPRIFLIALWSFIFLAMGPALSAESYGKGTPKIIWQTSGLGQPSAELQLGPNGLFYLPSGNKLSVLDDTGRKLWEFNGPAGGNKGRPVFDAYGSIFFPGSDLVQEIKLNGSYGWGFNVYQGKSTAAAQLTAGPGKLLYLPLPSALYAVDTLGRYRWMLLQWDSGNANRTLFATDNEILACAGNSKVVYAALKNKDKNSNLVAVSGEGVILWRYWLGDIKSVHLVPGPDNLLYITINPNKVDRLSRGKVLVINSEGNSLWSFSLAFNNLTAPAVSGHGLLYLCAGGKLFALNQEDGKEVWSQTLSKSSSRPAVDENSRRVYLGTDDNRLLAVTPQGRLDWDLQLDGKAAWQPLISPAGDIYVTTNKGTLYKIKDVLPASQGG